MKSIYKFLMLTGVLSLSLASCDDEYGPRKESTPIIQSAAVSPTSFAFGDSITLNATIIDPATILSTLSYEVVSGTKVIVSGDIPINNDTAIVSQPIYVPLLSGQDNGAAVQVNLIATNVLKGSAASAITGLTGNRPAYSRLYLVTDDGSVATLSAEASDKYVSNSLTYDSSFSFKIAEKLNADNTIDYSGDVYGNNNGHIAMIDEKGGSAFVYTSGVDYTKTFSFDNYAFSVSTSGNKLGADDIALSAFGDADVFNETFRTLTRTLEKNKTYTVVGKLADTQNIYNPDFFERTADNKVKFLGETGEYTIYYNSVRKNIIVGVDNPSYPDYLLACGYGLGYPTNVSSADIAKVYSGHQRTHTDWGFDHIMKYVLMRRIADGVFQGTFYTPGDNDHYAGFKPFENTGWGNEKKAGDFTFTGVPLISGDNDWTIPNGDDDPIIESANYRFTVDLNKKTVHIEKVTL